MNENSIDAEHVVTVVSPDTLEELVELLELRWPNRRIPAEELHALFGDLPGINLRVLVSHTGSGRSCYNTHEVAELLWGLKYESEGYDNE